MSKDEEQMGPSCEDQASPNTGDARVDEHQVEQDDQGNENQNEQAVGETYGAGPSVGYANV